MRQDEVLGQLYSLVVKGDAQKEMAQAVTPSVSSSRMSDQLALMTQQLELLKTVQQSQADLIGENSKAIVASTAASKVADAAKGVAGGLLSGFGISPIVSGLLKLFGGGGGGSAAVEAPIARYAAPDAVQLDAGLVGGDRVTAVDRGAGDRVRVIDSPAARSGATNVTVQVNAMDSRSFLDRSDEIARAVRLAMLESHAINDVVAEL